jgi:hypothetical protein
VGPTAGALLRRCAVPHEFDRDLLRYLGDLGQVEADERYSQFAELSLMQISDNKLSMQEGWREPLWQWWLEAARRSEFIALKKRSLSGSPSQPISRARVPPPGVACFT